LTVTPQDSSPVPGSVGKPLPGVEVKIDNPDAGGVGEVIARGKNLMLGYWEDQASTDQAIRDGWFHTGDLGRFDEDGNLFIVGRLKEVIIDTSGKNVYPDEIEDLYRDSPYIKEISVVGLPEGTTEQVAAAVVPELKKDESLSAADVAAKIEEHFASVSAGLPFWKRVKTLELWDGDLPKTAKRSVKRREVVAELLRRRAARPESGSAGVRDDKSVAWFLDAVATVTGRPRAAIAWKSRVSELGFDSLMYNELAEAIERAGVSLPARLDFAGAADVAGLYQIAVENKGGKSAARGEGRASDRGERDIDVPDVVARAGKRGVGAVQSLFYRKILDTKVEGEMHIPANTNFIVAANHSSHLDMGAIKSALGEAGHDLASLAAADYFFSNKWKRAAFSNFTNLVPMDRSGSIRKSLEAAEAVLRRGRSLVVFPEGTRSRTGEMADFLPSLGYLARRAEVGILPAYIAGSFEAMPKGTAIPKKRELLVKFGPYLSARFLDELTAELAQQEASRLVSLLVQRIVEGLRDGKPVPLGDAASVRAVWSSESQSLGPIVRVVKAGIGHDPGNMRKPRKSFPPAISTPAFKHHGGHHNGHAAHSPHPVSAPHSHAGAHHEHMHHRPKSSTKPEGQS
jgi:long-chain acyl-CoA synthetase